MCGISMAAHSAGSLEEVFDNPLIFQTPTAERHSLLIVGFDNFMGIVHSNMTVFGVNML